MASSSPPLPRITVFGSLNIDLVSYVPHHPAPGETLTANSFESSTGGKGANQAVACAKLSRKADLSGASADVCMVGAVGADAYGDVLIDGLKGFGVDTSGVTKNEAPASSLAKGDKAKYQQLLGWSKTGNATIIVDEPTGQNRIIFSPGANYSVLPSAAASGLLEPRPDLLVMQLEIPFDTVIAAISSAREAGVPVLLNPAPASILPAEAYQGLAHLVVNETEAALLSGCSESDLEGLEGLKRVGAQFRERGVANVIITLGGRGVYYASEDGQDALVPALKANVVDTTAAGDTFVGSYALAVVKASASGSKFDIDTAVKAANRAAAITVARKGAQVSIPWKDELA